MEYQFSAVELGGTSSEMVVLLHCANDLGNSWIEFLDPGTTGSIRVYNKASNMIETRDQAVVSSGDFWFHR
jgi:hypothetical protein